MKKASGGNGIPAELFQILKDDAVKKLHSVRKQIWKTQQWPQDQKSSVFIPIPKKGMPKNVQISAQLYSFHMLPRDNAQNSPSQASRVYKWRTLSISLLVCEMSAIVQQFEHCLALPFFGIGMKADIFQACSHCTIFQICWHTEYSTLTVSSFRI